MVGLFAAEGEGKSLLFCGRRRDWDRVVNGGGLKSNSCEVVFEINSMGFKIVDSKTLAQSFFQK